MRSVAVSVQTGKNGSVSPDGSVQVGQNDDQTFIITPDEGYEIYDVLVDGTSVGAVEKYTLKEVSAKHTIQAEFVASFTDVSSPDESMSRAMLAAVLYRAAGEPDSTGKETAVSFADYPRTACCHALPLCGKSCCAGRPERPF